MTNIIPLCLLSDVDTYLKCILVSPGKIISYSTHKKKKDNEHAKYLEQN